MARETILAGIVGTAALLAVACPAVAASFGTDAFVANVRPNVDYLDRSSRLALDKSLSGAIRAFAHIEALEQTVAANSIVAWTQTHTIRGEDVALGRPLTPTPADPGGLIGDVAALPLDVVGTVTGGLGAVVTGRSVAVDRPLTVTPGEGAEASTLGGQLLPSDRNDLSRLQGMSGRKFDALYRNTQLDSLRQLSTLYRDYEANGDDPAPARLGPSRTAADQRAHRRASQALRLGHRGDEGRPRGRPSLCRAFMVEGRASGAMMSEGLEKQARRVRDALDRYRVTSGKRFDLDEHEPDDLPHEMPGKHKSKDLLDDGIARLARLQELLYANKTWSLLVVFQAMDAAGKDSTIKHVMSGVNPQGVRVSPFKAPGPRELGHDFLWRVHRELPRRGMIGIFNRSHYEDVLVARVHKDLVPDSGLPLGLATADDLWRDRIADIAAFEAYLGRQGTRIVKFFLDVSEEEQKKRFLARLETPDKTWKFSSADLAERALWPKYRKAYQAAIAGTATPAAPWYVIPADRKWYMRLVVAEAIIQALESLDLKPPKVPDDERQALQAAHETLTHEAT